MKKRIILWRIITPSWRNTFGLKPTVPWNALPNSTDDDIHEEFFDEKHGISHYKYAYTIISKGVTPKDQDKIVKRWHKWAMVSFVFFVFSFLFLVISGGLYAFNYLDEYLIPIVSLTCSIQFFTLTISYFHRVKQVLVGAVFPKRLMLFDIRNLIDLDTGIYLHGQLVFKGLPLTGHYYEKIIRLEKSSHLEDLAGGTSLCKTKN